MAEKLLAQGAFLTLLAATWVWYRLRRDRVPQAKPAA
jgi:hypothetical protein